MPTNHDNSTKIAFHRGRRIVAKILCAALVVMACIVPTWMCLEWGLIPPDQGPREHFNRLEDRIALAREHLRGLMAEGCELPVGYFAGTIDWPSEIWRPGYFQARYALAPVPLDSTADHPLVLTNLGSEAALDDLLATGEFRLLKRFDTGLALLERQPVAIQAPREPQP